MHHSLPMNLRAQLRAGFLRIFSWRFPQSILWQVRVQFSEKTSPNMAAPLEYAGGQSHLDRGPESQQLCPLNSALPHYQRHLTGHSSSYDNTILTQPDSSLSPHTDSTRSGKGSGRVGLCHRGVRTLLLPGEGKIQ